MDADTTRRVLYNGTSTFFNSVSGSLFGIVANAVLLSVAGNDGVAAYGIIMYVNTVVFSLFTGMRRVRSLFVVMSVASAVMGVAVAALCILANEQLTRLFLGDGSVDVAAMASGGLTVFALTYLLSWVAVNVNQTLAATDLPAHALSIGVMSQLLLPTAFLIPMSSMGVDGIWWSMVVASVCSAAFSAAMLCLGARKGIFRMHGPVDTGPLTG